MKKEYCDINFLPYPELVGCCCDRFWSSLTNLNFSRFVGQRLNVGDMTKKNDVTIFFMISCALYICVQVKNQFVEHFIYKRKHDCALYFSWLYLCNREISFILSSWVLLPSPIKDLSENCSSRVWSAAIKNVPKTEQSWPSDRRFPQKSLYTQPVHLVKQAKDSFCFILSITVSAVVFFPLPKSFFFCAAPRHPL